MTFRGGPAGRGVCVCVCVRLQTDLFSGSFCHFYYYYDYFLGSSRICCCFLSLSLTVYLSLSLTRAVSRSRRKLFNAEMGNVMKKFLFFLSLCLGVLRVERKRKEEKKAQETPFISDVLFSLLCSPSLSLPHSRFFLPSVLPLKQIISNEIRKRRQRKKTEREGKRERKKLSVQQVGKFCCQVEVKVAPAVATE